jgi:hypothetical protein
MPRITSQSFCKFENDLLKSKFITDIRNVVTERLNEIDVAQFRTNPDLILVVCNVIWNACVDLKVKEEDIDKKQLVIDILQPLLNYTPTDIETVKSQIDYIVNHNQIIIIKSSTKIVKGLVNFVKKKLF